VGAWKGDVKVGSGGWSLGDVALWEGGSTMTSPARYERSRRISSHASFAVMVEHLVLHRDDAAAAEAASFDVSASSPCGRHVHTFSAREDPHSISSKASSLGGEGLMASDRKYSFGLACR